MDRTVSTPAPSTCATKKRGRDQENVVDCVKRAKSSLPDAAPSPAVPVASSSPVLPSPAFDSEDDDLAVLADVPSSARFPTASTYDAAINKARLRRVYELRQMEALEEQEAKLKEDSRKAMALQKRLYEERIADLDAELAARDKRLHAVKQVKREATAMVQEKSERERELLESAAEKDRQLESLQKRLDFERESWKAEKDGLTRDVNGWKDTAHKEHQKFVDYQSYARKLKEANKALLAEREKLKTELASLKNH